MLFSVYIPSLLLSFCQGMLLPILPIYVKSYNVNYGLVGLAIAAEGLGNLAGDLPSGVLLRKIGRKPTMLFGVGFVSLSALALSWAQVFPELIAYRLLAGVGTAMWGISRHAYIAEVAPVRERGRIIAIFGGVGRIGAFVGPAVGGAVGAVWGLKSAFLVYSVVAGGALAFCAVYLRDSHHPSPRIGPGANAGSLMHLLRQHYREFATAGSAQIFAQMIRASRQILIPIYGAEVAGLDVRSIGWILSISSALDMSMFYPAGLIMDRLGRKFSSVPSFLIQAIGMALVPFSEGFTGLLLTASIIGLGNGIGSGSMMTLGADLAPRDAMGEFLGVWRLIGDVGNGAGPLVVGGIADLLGLGASAFVMSGVGLLAASTLLLLVRETLVDSQ